MRHSLAVFLLTSPVWFVAIGFASPNAEIHAAEKPTFNEHVLPIFVRKCGACHQPGHSAPALNLLSYEMARSQLPAIGSSVKAGRMPPWPADPKGSLPFSNDRRLSDSEKATILRWIERGAPEGPRTTPPLAPSTEEDWGFPGGRKPDAIVKLSEVNIPAHGELGYVQQRVKLDLPADRWVIAMQVRPGNAEIVHHVGITEVILPNSMSAADVAGLSDVAARLGVPADALLASHPAVSDAETGTYDMMGVYTPGSTIEMYAPDSARLLKADKAAYIDFNIHFTTNGVAQKNHSELALWFQPNRPSHQLFRAPVAVGTLIVNRRELLTDDPGTKAEGTDFAIPPIPAYAHDYELVGMTAYQKPIVIYQLQPHAHMRAKSFRYVAIYPDGHELTLLTVPQYDFHWQLAYTLAEPLHLPAGSKLVVSATFDNSPSNKHFKEIGVDPANCGPDKVALFRRENQSWDEMFTPLAQYAVDPLPAGAHEPRMIKTRGCLVARSQGWSLEAGSVVPTGSLSTSAGELKQDARFSKENSRSFRLIGVDAFQTLLVEGSRVAIKGLLVNPGRQPGITVTSLQRVPGGC